MIYESWFIRTIGLKLWWLRKAKMPEEEMLFDVV